MLTIPLYKPFLDKHVIKNVNLCLTSSWISSKGKFIYEFEKKFSNFTKIKHSVTLTSGTTALHIALKSLSISSLDEVIVPSLSFVASANCVKYVNASPVFVDVKKDSWIIDESLIEKKINKRTKAIIVVHLYGVPCNLSKLKKIAKKHNLYLIEDCAEALGSYYNNKHVGSFGDVSIFSFYGNKTITTGEGGMIVTNNKKIAKRCDYLKKQALNKGSYYRHGELGYNYRMTNICASIGSAQMNNIKKILKKKKKIADFYHDNLKYMPIKFQSYDKKNIINSHWLVSFTVERKNLRDKLMKFLLKKGIETRPVFYPIHKMKIYRTHKKNDMNNTEYISKNGISLPSYPQLEKKEILYVCKKIKDFFNKIYA